MNKLYKIIREEFVKFIKEYYEDEYDTEYEIKQNIFNDFLYKNTPDFTKHIPWQVIKFPRLKKIWEDYMRTGVVRDTRGLKDIKDIMIDNTIKIGILTALAGHTQWGDEEAFEENIGYWVDQQINCLFPQKKEDRSQLEIPFNNPKQGYVKKEPAPEPEPCEVQIHPFAQQLYDNYADEDLTKEKFRELLYEEMKGKFLDNYMDDSEHKMGGFISDYGLRPLQILLGQLMSNTEPENDIPIIDKMLNVIHQRSDIASWFVEGGSHALNQLSGYGDEEGESVISGKYKISDYY